MFNFILIISEIITCKDCFGRIKKFDEEALLQHCRNCVNVTRPNLSFRYTCLVCDYHTIHAADMRKHLRIHTGVKPFKCQYCSYTSSRKNVITQHILIKHSWFLKKSIFSISYVNFLPFFFIFTAVTFLNLLSLVALLLEVISHHSIHFLNLNITSIILLVAISFDTFCQSIARAIPYDIRSKPYSSSSEIRLFSKVIVLSFKVLSFSSRMKKKKSNQIKTCLGIPT